MNYIDEKSISNPALGLDLKILIKNNNPYFIGTEVARKLEYKNERRVIRDYIKERHKMALEKFCEDIPSEERSEIFSKMSPLTVIIDEPSFYLLCTRSSSRKVEEFQEWVCEILVNIRKGIISNILVPEDNPLMLIRQLISQIPRYKEHGDNSLRKEMCRVFKEAYNLAKNPYQVKAGKKGGKRTQKDIREMKKTLDELKDKIERSIEKVETKLEKTLQEISSSDESSDSEC